MLPFRVLEKSAGGYYHVKQMLRPVFKDWFQKHGSTGFATAPDEDGNQNITVSDEPSDTDSSDSPVLELPNR